ncbi:MAG: glycosyl transferase [Thermobacillus sp.]|nr:glycosyltransferase [Thermobacillus sp.]REK55334.1 MAG: glycosyl transferase [Thermobacillus sp.]
MKRMGPTVSIIIPFHNDPYIAQAVESALSQTYPYTEVIVVDDGSTACQHLLDPYRRHIHYLGKANGGTASALNHGIRMASGQYVAWLSSDDRFVPTKIERQVMHMHQTGARICHTNFHVMNESGGIVQHNGAAVFPTAKQFAAAFLTFCPVNGCTVMMKKTLVAELGWFNESLPYTHDYDLWIRALLSGIDFHFINEPLTIYRRHAGMGTMLHFPAIQAEVQMVQNRYRWLLEHRVNAMPG